MTTKKQTKKVATKKATKKTGKRPVSAKNPKQGQYVWDTHYKCRRMVMSVPRDDKGLYFIGVDHEPVRRNEFIFPLPSPKKAPQKATRKRPAKKTARR